MPFTVLSDAEYESMLRERLLAVEAEIALVDEKVASLRAQGGKIEETKDREEVEKGKWDRGESG